MPNETPPARRGSRPSRLPTSRTRPPAIAARAAARIAERGDQLERAIARITAERDALANGIREAADALAEATTAEAAASEARTVGEEAREAARQALLDAERQLGGGAGRVTELEAAAAAGRGRPVAARRGAGRPRA